MLGPKEASSREFDFEVDAERAWCRIEAVGCGEYTLHPSDVESYTQGVDRLTCRGDSESGVFDRRLLR